MIETREFNQAVRDAGVMTDRLVPFPISTRRKPVDLVLHEIVVVSAYVPDGTAYLFRILLNLDSAIIGPLNRHRWQIDPFFRCRNHDIPFDHLFTHSRKGGAPELRRRRAGR